MATTAQSGDTGRVNGVQVAAMNDDPSAMSPRSADQLLALLRSHETVWRQRYHLQRIGLFGSTARNEATAGSDVDVWVELHPLTPFATVHLREHMNPALRQAILREGVSA